MYIRFKTMIAGGLLLKKLLFLCSVYLCRYIFILFYVLFLIFAIIVAGGGADADAGAVQNYTNSYNTLSSFPFRLSFHCIHSIE